MNDNETRTRRAMVDAFAMTLQRCYNAKCRDYPHYGGRGIQVCDRWRESAYNMVEDMGLRPSGMTLERVDNDGPYSPENCVWASRSVQSSNKRITKLVTFRGQTKLLTEWASELDIKYHTLKARLGVLGYSVDEAFTKSVKYGVGLPGKVYKVRRSPDMSKISRGMARATLNLDQVLEMRKAHLSGTETFTSLGKKFNVSVTTASNAIQGLKAYSEV